MFGLSLVPFLSASAPVCGHPESSLASVLFATSFRFACFACPFVASPAGPAGAWCASWFESYCVVQNRGRSSQAAELVASACSWQALEIQQRLSSSWVPPSDLGMMWWHSVPCPLQPGACSVGYSQRPSARSQASTRCLRYSLSLMRFCTLTGLMGFRRLGGFQLSSLNRGVMLLVML